MTIQANNIGHLIRQHVLAVAQNEQRPVYAHIASYDPQKHTVKVIIPSMRDPYTGEFVLSPELQYGTPAAGPNGGFQYHPVTGATQEKPTAGEQVQLSFFGNSGGIAAVSSSYFNDNKPTLAAMLPKNDPLSPGEFIIGQSAGNYVRIRSDGGADLSGIAVRLGDLTEALQTLLNKAAMNLFNAHTHPANGQPPTQQMVAGTHTTTQTVAN